MMKEKGIGRPSTYSKAIENNKRHGYIIETKRGYLIPTKIGISVYDYISKLYPSISTEKATRKLENLIEKVQNGEISPDDALETILKDLAANVGIFKTKLLSIDSSYLARLKI
jgi:reverse gyrase